MITTKKILSLKPRLQTRKCGEIFHLAGKGESFPAGYLAEVGGILLKNPLLPLSDADYISALLERNDSIAFEDIYQRTLRLLGESMADWDFTDTEGVLDEKARSIKPHHLFLDRVRSPFNVGSIFRSAESFCVDMLYLEKGTADPSADRAKRSARGATEVLPYRIIDSLTSLPGPFFALELGGEDISKFTFPKEGTCIIGSEETGVSPEALALADASFGRVSIPLYGAKGSLNVSVATGILLYMWAEKG